MRCSQMRTIKTVADAASFAVLMSLLFATLVLPLLVIAAVPVAAVWMLFKLL